MSGKGYTSYNLFFIHHEDTKDTKFMFFLRALRVFVVRKQCVIRVCSFMEMALFVSSEIDLTVSKHLFRLNLTLMVSVRP